MKKATIVHWISQRDGVNTYQVLHVQVSKPGPVLVVDLATAVVVDEFKSRCPPGELPAEWTERWATDEWPALDWRKG